MKHFRLNISTLALLLVITCFSACTKKPEGSISVTTKAVTDITENSAKCGGSVSGSGYAVGDCGVCYGKYQNPILNDSTSSIGFTIDREGTGSFSSTLNNLKPGTTYYVRAYAKTSSGIEYGDEKSFKTLGDSGGGGSSDRYTINVFAEPTTGGTVTGAGTYQTGQSCTITATANTGYTFANWTENGTAVSNDESYSFTVSDSRNFTANFSQNSYSIMVSVTPENSGTVIGGGNYNHGQSCTLIATANSGYAFTNWTENGEVVSNNTSYTFTATGDRTLVANFHVSAPPTGAINGSFSISENAQVWFSQGNLQYQASTNTWRFAENQWDYVGTQNNTIFGITGGTVNGSDNSNISPTYNGWIDLFCWGTSGYDHGAVCYQPYSTSKNQSDYYAYGSSSYNLFDQTEKADWGYNAISNGGNTENAWRTLTQDEWVYVISTRNTPSGIRYAKAQVNNVNGVIILPDNWNASTYELKKYNSGTESYSINIISAASWGILESAGAVFLPAAGNRYNGTTVDHVSIRGNYWASTYYNDYCTYCLYFYSHQDDGVVRPLEWDFRYNGNSVRLVCPVE